jgi:SAM-dependent methyltransferase
MGPFLRKGSAMAQKLDLQVGYDEIAQVFAPGIQRVAAADDPEWVTREKRLNAKAAKKEPWWRKLLQAARPDAREVYEKKWTPEAALARFTPRPDNIDPVVWRDNRYFAYSIWIKRIHLLFLMHLIETLKPARVLELGSGMGLNLMMLAARFPDVRFSGIELTSAGHEIAQTFRSEPAFPQQLREFSPQPLIDETAHQKVELHQGTAAQLPFQDGSFDLVYSTMALEQMDAIREQVFKEIARVSSGHAAMFEQFADFNEMPMRKALVAQRGFFSASIADLSHYGLTPVFVTSDMPSKLSMGVGLVVAAVKTR